MAAARTGAVAPPSRALQLANSTAQRAHSTQALTPQPTKHSYFDQSPGTNLSFTHLTLKDTRYGAGADVVRGSCRLAASSALAERCAAAVTGHAGRWQRPLRCVACSGGNCWHARTVYSRLAS